MVRCCSRWRFRTRMRTRPCRARWQYALDVAAQRGGADIQVERGAMPAHWDWPLAAPLVLQAPARGRLEADGGAGVARRSVARRPLGDDSFDSLRLHEVPHFDVSRDAPGLGRGKVRTRQRGRESLLCGVPSQARGRRLPTAVQAAAGGTGGGKPQSSAAISGG